MELVVCGKDEVAEVSSRWKADFIISIGEISDPPPRVIDIHDPAVLRLEFSDTFPDEDFGGPGYDGPTEADVEELIQFCRHVTASGGKTLVHCQAGISRSSACALTLLAVKLGPGREAQAVAELRRLHGASWFHPNRHVVDLADRQLGRQGALLSAMRSVFYPRMTWRT